MRANYDDVDVVEDGDGAGHDDNNSDAVEDGDDVDYDLDDYRGY